MQSALTTIYYATTTQILAAQDIGTPEPAPPPGAPKVTLILSWVIWGAVIATVAGFIVAAAMLGWQRMQGGGGDAQGKLVGAMIGAALIAAAGTIINAVYLAPIQ
ncbi:hypothetical protein ACQP2U_43210 (plasmid) [Nocardia sp. CA-084685]|uniref:hypothetical protein n=1 Tax=Nocardia sp. CA-084685 TaxID=3239970 RepID=UPI003D95EB9C